MYVQWRTGKATRNVGDSVATCQERTATVCDVGLQIVQQIQLLKKYFN